MEVSAGGDKVVAGRMENFGKLLGITLAWLSLVWAVPIDNLLYLVEQDPVLSLDLSGSILLDLNCLGVGDRLQMINFQSVHSPESFTQHLSVLLVILVVKDAIQQLAGALLLNGNFFDTLHIC